MSNNILARGLGFCLLVFGLCGLTLLDFSVWGLLVLIGTVLLGVVKIALSLLAMIFVFVGVAWALKPSRVIEAIVRNHEIRQNAKRD